MCIRIYISLPFDRKRMILYTTQKSDIIEKTLIKPKHHQSIDLHFTTAGSCKLLSQKFI